MKLKLFPSTGITQATTQLNLGDTEVETSEPTPEVTQDPINQVRTSLDKFFASQGMEVRQELNVRMERPFPVSKSGINALNAEEIDRYNFLCFCRYFLPQIDSALKDGNIIKENLLWIILSLSPADLDGFLTAIEKAQGAQLTEALQLLNKYWREINSVLGKFESTELDNNYFTFMLRNENILSSFRTAQNVRASLTSLSENRGTLINMEGFLGRLSQDTQTLVNKYKINFYKQILEQKIQLIQHLVQPFERILDAGDISEIDEELSVETAVKFLLSNLKLDAERLATGGLEVEGLEEADQKLDNLLKCIFSLLELEDLIKQEGIEADITDTMLAVIDQMLIATVRPQLKSFQSPIGAKARMQAALDQSYTALDQKFFSEDSALTSYLRSGMQILGFLQEVENLSDRQIKYLQSREKISQLPEEDFIPAEDLWMLLEEILLNYRESKINIYKAALKKKPAEEPQTLIYTQV